MIKTKKITATHTNYGRSDGKYIPLDENINLFLKENNIDDFHLVDIKYAPVGFFQGGNGEGQLEGSALIIYKDYSDYIYQGTVH
ncbi:sporulation protein Cse60 [Cytobacillus kochii]|uniref:sporulation protein Cse60 n=1 Tax=Cytobacillus kochii TaxID=859143 RepID=UPI001CD4801F|nr:sporulation protein Cse60 [Cytobacillus kochii]MCA1027016.1 sporulation protein Cse60 [Cytobacillus kochii]